MLIDVDKLRKDLMDYFGTAMSMFPQAVIDLTQIEMATPQQLVDIAISNNFNLSDYEIKSKSK